jgi:hypothetical protein
VHLEQLLGLAQMTPLGGSLRGSLGTFTGMVHWEYPFASNRKVAISTAAR